MNLIIGILYAASRSSLTYLVWNAKTFILINCHSHIYFVFRYSGRFHFKADFQLDCNITFPENIHEWVTSAETFIILLFFWIHLILVSYFSPHPVHSLLKSAFNSIAIEKEKLKQMVSEQDHNKGHSTQMARLRQSLSQVNESVCTIFRTHA